MNRLLLAVTLVVLQGALAAQPFDTRRAVPSNVEGQRPGVHPLTGREYALPMSAAAAGWLDRDERQREEDTALSLMLIGIQQGSVVADIGAGSGYYSTRLARLVGPAGRVYASDIQQAMLDIIRRRIEREGITNIEIVLGTPTDPRLPRAAVDLALLVDVYHEFSEPQAMLGRIRESLKPSGRLILLEYRGEDPRVPILPAHKMTVAQAKTEVEAEGFALTTVKEDLPWQHVLIFTVR
jgi:protein-L-isoaspartate O-methyltransferase